MPDQWLVRVGEKVSRKLTSAQVQKLYKQSRIPVNAELSNDGKKWISREQFAEAFKSANRGREKRPAQQAGSSTSSPVKIVLECTCGKRLIADRRLLGKKSKCPACSVVIDVVSKPAVSSKSTKLVPRSVDKEASLPAAKTEPLTPPSVSALRDRPRNDSASNLQLADPTRFILLCVAVEVAAIFGTLYGFHHVDKWEATKQFSVPDFQAGHSDHSLHLSDDQIVFGSFNWRLLDIREGKFLASRNRMEEPLAVSHATDLIVMADSISDFKSGVYSTLELYQADTFERVLKFQADEERPRDRVVAAAFGANDKKLFTVTSKGKLQRWDITSGAEEWSAQLDIGSVKSLDPFQSGHPHPDYGLVVFSHDARYLATSDGGDWHNDHIRIWQVSNAKPLPQIDVGGEISAFTFTSDDRLLATISMLTGKTETRPNPQKRGDWVDLPDGSRGQVLSTPAEITSYFASTHLLAWEIDGTSRAPAKSQEKTMSMIVGLSQNGELIATSADTARQVQLWETDSLTRVATITETLEGVDWTQLSAPTCLFSADGSKVTTINTWKKKSFGKSPGGNQVTTWSKVRGPANTSIAYLGLMIGVVVPVATAVALRKPRKQRPSSAMAGAMMLMLGAIGCGGSPAGVAIQEYLHKVTDGAAGSHLGYAVAISGKTTLIGAPMDRGANGSAYLYDVTTGKRSVKRIAANARAGHERLGLSVAIDGKIAIVGAPYENYACGAAYLFDATTRKRIARVTAPDSGTEDKFGKSVGISGSSALVGAPGDDTGSDSGSAYLFDVSTGKQLAKLTAANAEVSDAFGWSVALSGKTAVVGASNDSDAGENAGSAYFFDVAVGEQTARRPL